MKITKQTFLLVLVLLLALFLRLYQLDKIPASLFGDEMDVSYQAWSLGTTGRDYMGNLLPTFLHSFSEWRTPLLSYILSPLMAIFGPSTLSVRIPTALLGVLNIYLIYLFFQKLLPKYKQFSILAAFILCISPWHIHFSRIAFDSTLLLNLYLLGTILLLDGKFALSLPVLILTLYTYPTANIFTPLLIVASYLIFRPAINLKKHLFIYLLSLALIIPIAVNIISGSASGRFSGISIFADTKLTDSIVTARTESWVVGNKIEPIFHNKPIAYLNTFVNQYVSAFSTNFLFVSGDPNFRHSIGEFGEFYIFFAPLLFIGFFSLLSRLGDPKARFILAWLILAPVPSALTQGGGSHAIRLIILLPALVTLFTLALVDITDFLKKSNYKKIFILSFIFLSLLATTFYWHRYSSHYRYLSQRHWQYGYETVMTNLPRMEETNRLFINNTYEPSLLKYLYYSKFPPKEFQKIFVDDITKTSIVPGFDGFRLGDNIFFGSIQPGVYLDTLLQSGDMYIASQRKEIPGDQDWSKNPPLTISVVSISYDTYGVPLFTVIKRK